MLESIIFGTFAGLLVGSSMMVVFARQTIYSILWLVLSFISAAALWISLNAEFLGLLLILVYVGAVLTLFLFVIMTLSSSTTASDRQYMMHYILSFSIALIGLSCITYGVYRHTMVDTTSRATQQIVVPLYQEKGTHALGMKLYTDFVYPFELVGILLLTAIIVSISLHSRSHKTLSNRQPNQTHIKRQHRIKLVQGD